MKLASRAITTWAIEAAALAILVVLVPGVHVASWQIDLVAVVVIGALNAVVRPIVLLLAVNLGLAPFALITLVLNAAIVMLASLVLPGFVVDSAGTAFGLAFGLAVLNTLISGLLGINDDDSFYRNVIRWLERRRAPQAGLDETGTIFIQIDGLAEPILHRSLDSDELPTLARWISSGSHRVVSWECDIPSMTSSGQSGILYGNNANIPAFRWYDKASKRLFVSNHPRDARIIDDRQSTGDGLLLDHGSSIGNIFAGGADHCVITMSRLMTETGRISARAQDLYDYFINPYNLYRALGAMAWEILVELWEAWQQRRRNVHPRMDRGGVYPLVRAITTVLLRDITTWMLIADMFAGRRLAYADYLSYDEVAHHSGPASIDARRVLRKMEGQFRQLDHAARLAPRRYRFVVLSDHGQSTGATFRQRYGVTLGELVDRLTRPDMAVHVESGQGEGSGELRALITEAELVGGLAARAMRFVRRLGGASVAEQPDGGHESDIVVCASGNLALIYFTQQPGRLSLEQINQFHPGLIDGLVQHPGIGFVMVDSEGAGGPRILSTRGAHEGADPLDGLSSHTLSFLRRLSTYPNVGDIVVNSLWEGESQQVAAFEELIGCHGGAGGLQTAPFVLCPAEWGDPPEPIVGAESLHRFLKAGLASSE